MHIQILDNLATIDAYSWNALITDKHPFCQYEFLSALEQNHCIGKKFGWIPRHVAATEKNKLLGAVILYEKHNNYGEFVFDHIWHHAYQQSGLDYYPKLVSTTPYTPTKGLRFLCQDKDKDKILPLLLKHIFKLNESICSSSIHCLFVDQSTTEWLRSQNFYTRTDCQFHWHNQNYQSFDAFLQNLRAKKRKNIRQERQKIANTNIHIRQLDGHSATDEDWQNFAYFYTHTFIEKHGIPTLNVNFFKRIAKTMPSQVLLFLADQGNTCVAGALMFKSDTHLYGRHWGCIEQIDFLHFELCYYQGIEYCIKHGLQVFEPGAQGEHKVARGFTPVLTQSSHYIKHKGFQEPIAHFCKQEAMQIEQYIAQVQTHNPYQNQS